MIQRIQTVFLVAAVALLVFLVFNPIAELLRLSDDTIFHLNFKGLFEVVSGDKVGFNSLPLSILITLCLTITFITIFLFKKRVLQIRLSIANIVMLIGLQGLFLYYVNAAKTVLQANVSYKIFFIFPVAAAILVFLALRAIAKDEALVRSLDRLR